MDKKKGEEIAVLEGAEEEIQDQEKDKSDIKIADNGVRSLDEMSKDELVEKVKELQDKTDKNYELYLRAQAEMENLIKRGRKEKEEWHKYSNETLIKEILPVMDNLEKAMTHANDNNPINALREGISLTLKGLRDTLQKSGLEEVEAMGKPFDPNFHHAVAEKDVEDVDAGIILEELQKGYILNKRLIRPSMVVLSKAKPSDDMG